MTPPCTMDPPAPQGERDEGQSPAVVGLRPTVIGTYVSLSCRSCAEVFESYQPTIAGLPVGMHACPRCSAGAIVRADDLDAALTRYWPGESMEEMTQLTAEATRIATTWHGAGPVRSLLSYRGVGLGAATERELLSTVTLGLVEARNHARTRQ